MKIGIDARLISQTGVGVYIRNLLYYLAKTRLPMIKFYIYLRHGDMNRFDFLEGKQFVKRLADFHWHSMDEQIRFLNLLYRDRLNLMHFTYFSFPILYKRPFIITIHDLIPFYFATGKASTHYWLFYQAKNLIYRQVIRTAIHNAHAIITPTQTVKSEIIKEFGKQFSDKINVTYEGVNFEIETEDESDMLKRSYSKQFMIYIGNFYPHKNVERLVEAYSQIDTEVKLVLIGPDDYFSQRIVQRVKEIGASGKIYIYKNPDLAELVFFYNNTHCLVQPSLSEGFGLPLIETSYFEKPVIASNIPVFNETMDSYYLKFDPRNTSDIKEIIEKFLRSDLKKLILPKNILQKKYSFKKMATQTLDIYKKTLQKP